MVTCKRCNKEVESVSRRGLCTDCSTAAMYEAARQMHEKKGTLYELAQARRKAAKEVTDENIPLQSPH